MNVCWVRLKRMLIVIIKAFMIAYPLHLRRGKEIQEITVFDALMFYSLVALLLWSSLKIRTIVRPSVEGLSLLIDL